MRCSPRGLAITLLGALLISDSVAALASGLLGAAYPQQLDYGESIVYGQAARILDGEALYQAVDRPPYTVTAYTPLYYMLCAGLRALLGPGFVWGRAASLLAGIVTVFLVAYLAARIGKSAGVGVLAAGIFLTFSFPGFIPWFGLYRVDMLGVAFSVAALAVLAGATSNARLVAAGCLAALAVLTKQTLFAASLAGLVWLWPSGWRRACLFGGTMVLIVALTSAFLELTTKNYISNTIWSNINPIEFDALSSRTSVLIFNQLVPVTCAIFFLVSSRRWWTADTRLLVLYWCATLPSMIGIAKVGANHNYWIEFGVATSILGANGIWLAAVRSSGRLRNSVSIGLLCLMLLQAGGLAGTAVPAGGLMSLYRYVLDARRSDGEFDALVARVQAEPKTVLADPLDVVVLADRSIEFEPLIYSIFESQGSWNPQPLVQRICRGDVGLLVLGQPIEKRAEAGIQGYSMWPRPVLTALQHTMVLEGTQAGRFVYVPRGSSELPAICRATG